MVFTGVPNAPSTHCSNQNGLPITNLEYTESISEKPFITVDSSSGTDVFKLQIPIQEEKKIGTTNWSFTNMTTEVDFSEVYVAKDTDDANILQTKHDAGVNYFVL